MRISMKLTGAHPAGVKANPGTVAYNASTNRLVLHYKDGSIFTVSLDDFDFTLHEKCEMPAPAELVAGEAMDFGGIYLSAKTLVEVIDAARES